MLSRRPRSRAIPGRGIWAGLALIPILIALAALVASAFLGGAATAGSANATAISPAAAKARVRPTRTRTEQAQAVAEYWTSARMAKATDIVTGRHASPDVASPDVPEAIPGPPHTSFNWYPGFPRRPQHRSVLIYYTQGGTEHVCSGGVMGWDAPDSAAIEGPQNIVWTAGRCIHRGDGSQAAASWSDQVMACPIHQSTGPFSVGTGGGTVNEGCWIWQSEATTPEWFGDNWESRDYGVIFLSNSRVTCPNAACTAVTTISGTDIAAYPPSPGTPKGTFTLCNERTVPTVTHTDCAYNLPRAQAWWAIGYHNPTMLQRQPGYVPTGGNPPPNGNIAANGCDDSTVPPNAARVCFPLTLRVTQMQYASTHAALPPNPGAANACGDPPNNYTCAADLGPQFPNTVGDYQQVGVDSSRLTASPCPEQYKATSQPTAQTPPCTGSFTGAPWIVSSGLNNHGWNGNETNFGSTRINSNSSYADPGEDDLPNVAYGVYGGSMQGPYYDLVTCFDYQAWTGWPGTCS